MPAPLTPVQIDKLNAIIDQALLLCVEIHDNSAVGPAGIGLNSVTTLDGITALRGMAQRLDAVCYNFIKTINDMWINNMTPHITQSIKVPVITDDLLI